MYKTLSSRLCIKKRMGLQLRIFNYGLMNEKKKTHCVTFFIVYAGMNTFFIIHIIFIHSYFIVFFFFNLKGKIVIEMLFLNNYL